MADSVESRDEVCRDSGFLRHLQSLCCVVAPLEQHGGQNIFTSAKLLLEDCFLPKEKCQTNVPMMSFSIDSKDANRPEAGCIISLPQKDETPLDSKPSFSIPKALGEEMDALGGTAAWGGSDGEDLEPESGEEIPTPDIFQFEYRRFTEANFGTGPSALSRLRRFQSPVKEYHKGIRSWCQLRGLRIRLPYEFLESVSPPRRFASDKLEYHQGVSTCSIGEKLATLLIGSLMDTLFVQLAMIILSTKWWRWTLLLFGLIWPPA